MFRVPRSVGVVSVDLGEPESPDVLQVNVIEFKDYLAEHANRFKVQYGDDWAGPLVAAFFGRPYTAEEWSEGRASLAMEYFLGEYNALKKPVPDSGTPAS